MLHRTAVDFGQTLFAAYRSSDDERYASVGTFAAEGQVVYQAPPRSVALFYGSQPQ